MCRSTPNNRSFSAAGKPQLALEIKIYLPASNQPVFLYQSITSPFNDDPTELILSYFYLIPAVGDLANHPKKCKFQGVVVSEYLIESMMQLIMSCKKL
jgi:hypothetical protein